MDENDRNSVQFSLLYLHLIPVPTYSLHRYIPSILLKILACLVYLAGRLEFLQLRIVPLRRVRYSGAVGVLTIALQFSAQCKAGVYPH